MILPDAIKQQELQRTFETLFKPVLDMQERAALAAPYKTHKKTNGEWLAQHPQVYAMFKRFVQENPQYNGLFEFRERI